MVYIADLPQRGCWATLIRAFSGAWCAGHHLCCSDSVWQQTQAGFTCTSHKLSQTSNQIRNCRDDSVIWGSDRPVRAVIIFYQEEIWIWPQVCCLLVCAGILWVNVSHQNLRRQIYILIKTSVIALDCQFQKAAQRRSECSCPWCWNEHRKTAFAFLL